MPRSPTDGAALAACLAVLEQRAPRPLTIVELARLAALARYDRKALRAALEAAVADGRLRRIGKTRYQWRREGATGAAPRRARAERGAARRVVEGRYVRVRGGFGFVEPLGAAAGQGRDVLIPAGMEGDALHGDRVRLELLRRDPRARRVVGRVAAVVEPAHRELIGVLERHDGRWLLLPLDERLPWVELHGTPRPRAADAGQAARVRLERAAPPGRGVGAVLDRVLGPPDDPEVQFLAIAAEHGLRVAHAAATLAEAAALPGDPSDADVRARTDLRHLPFVTIDGETARDFDDAICLEERPAGGLCLWVAIADVAHYVRPGTALDAEAAARGTSVYFPDRAIPMLPARLSSELCSLMPERDRLVLVAELHYTAGRRRPALRCYRAVIRSRARLTYTRVAAVLSDTDTAEIAAWRAELAPLLPALRRMHAFMRRLNAWRLADGSLDLDLPEALVDLSEAGRSIGVRVAPRNDAHRLIEEFMLEANRAVAAWLGAQGVPFPYRIHEPPLPDDVEELNQQLAPWGLRVEYDAAVEPADVQRLLDRLQGHRLGRVLSRLVLRALRQARYSTDNAGHFGLAFPVYCHFTSPIRRYPDLLVHRQIGRLLDGDLEAARADAAAIAAACVHSSAAEREAMEAERAMLDLRKAEFMLDHLLEPGEATVVSLTNAGVFVELDAWPVEGLVRAEHLPGWVPPAPRRDATRARRPAPRRRTAGGGGRPYRLGDRLVVEATNASPQRRQVDFALVRRLADADPPRRQPQARRRPPPRRGR